MKLSQLYRMRNHKEIYGGEFVPRRIPWVGESEQAKSTFSLAPFFPLILCVLLSISKFKTVRL